MITVSESNLYGPGKVQLIAEWDSFVHTVVRLRNGQKGPCDCHRSGFVDPYANFYRLQILPIQENLKDVKGARGQEITLDAYTGHTDQKKVCH